MYVPNTVVKDDIGSYLITVSFSKEVPHFLEIALVHDKIKGEYKPQIILVRDQKYLVEVCHSAPSYHLAYDNALKVLCEVYGMFIRKIPKFE